MRVTEFLEGRDLHQLRSLRDTVEAKIAEIEAEEKVRLWVVEDRDLREFYSTDYEAAARKLLELALERKFTDDISGQSLALVPIKVPASEVTNYIST